VPSQGGTWVLRHAVSSRARGGCRQRRLPLQAAAPAAWGVVSSAGVEWAACGSTAAVDSLLLLGCSCLAASGGGSRGCRVCIVYSMPHVCVSVCRVWGLWVHLRCAAHAVLQGCWCQLGPAGLASPGLWWVLRQGHRWQWQCSCRAARPSPTGCVCVCACQCRRPHTSRACSTSCTCMQL
jgi:hypothetical protein